MLIKLDLADGLATLAARVMPVPWLRAPLSVALATMLCRAVGLGIRWVGVSGIIRAIRGKGDRRDPGWRLLAWVAVAGVAIPFVLVTVPYHDTLQFYQTGLYVMWIFTACAFTDFARRHGMGGRLLVACAVGASLPSTMHYLGLKWSDNQRPPLVALGASEIAVADRLRALPPEDTVVLHDRPLDPSLLTVVSQRRVVLAWARYAVGSDDRRRDVDRFFASAEREPEVGFDVLRRYSVTHVIDRPGRDRIHPEVLSRLQPVVAFPDVVLYEVPKTGLGPDDVASDRSVR
jgi:hypothetical protein